MSRENRIAVMLTDEELKAIDDWRFANRVATRAEAIRRLVTIGTQIKQEERAA